MDASTLESRWAPRVLSSLRLISGLLLVQHGAAKLFGVLSENPHPPPLVSPVGFAGVLEFFGGLALAIGLCTRSVAFVLSGLMAVAYFWKHAPGGFWPVLNHGELAVIYCWVYFYIFAAGPGCWSVDARISRRPAA